MVEFPTTRNALEPGCERCPALVDSRECISWGTGPLDASVVVVGEAPGAGLSPDEAPDEQWRGGNWTGKAFTTRHSGRRIRRLLDEAGYGDDVYYTNAVKCFPEAEDGSNREPTDEECRTCRRHLDTELDRIDPDVIVPAGKHASRSVFALADRSLDGFLDCVLDPVESASIEPAVLPILHPSYQDIWIARLGYESDEYVATFAERLDALAG
ncbi:uracil-DNA glycosylase [Natranaeroarchaeum aerophilus]|uniref:Uracil-DNA glycosylase n=1 Tax=Natranaeroarchaeum aerophilus TaxID=2917711 RepID=A0AAE3K442_9EURY|nr:uracil-DNA glycosylase family protein [Natranaeroarchaeum aerophilus]MCL9812305.1 uracil-DNA glycosylase [Natranaeroarchaeum aerophilus]